MALFLKGLLIGFAIAAPVGPIGVLCIRRTLTNGRWNGFLSGLGAATADMLYGAVAAFGLAVVRDNLVRQQFWLRLIGGLFLLYLGLRTFLTRPAEKAAIQDNKLGLLSAYLSTFALTLTNPATIISFTVIFAGLRLVESTGDYSALFVVAGVFLGSASWWLTLSSVVGIFRQRFTAAWMLWVNRLAGTVIFGFGLTALLIK
jgi:threonine/homoserine/homoserine lactone efflux protein